MYTTEKWMHDREPKAAPGQEIEQEIYEHMLSCLPPKALPAWLKTYCLQNKDMPAIHTGFLAGEMMDTDQAGKPRYMAFGKSFTGKPGECHWYYLGLASYEPPLNGEYYCFETLDADLEGLKERKEFGNKNF